MLRCQEFLNNISSLDSGQADIEPTESEGEFLGMDAELVEYGGVDIVDGEGLGDATELPNSSVCRRSCHHELRRRREKCCSRSAWWSRPHVSVI